ncbi:MAG: hypothetical protein PF569_06770 [Candidatus Woesearchaeota archaeon]|jgi:hypothetical protein|nr:hypothetical protein [Candidatus Woesearchaeota archaeon]
MSPNYINYMHFKADLDYYDFHLNVDIDLVEKNSPDKLESVLFNTWSFMNKNIKTTIPCKLEPILSPIKYKKNGVINTGNSLIYSQSQLNDLREIEKEEVFILDYLVSRDTITFENKFRFPIINIKDHFDGLVLVYDYIEQIYGVEFEFEYKLDTMKNNIKNIIKDIKKRDKCVEELFSNSLAQK